ncbi:hypothetical protein L600_000900000710 [Isoptericola variabilis J7]|uniref:copper resistance CopC family protein n=1 Tax=Isoptericola variabilis TaxID=139208 RepID=UPI0011A359AF|nr:copper resistance CopC family protein [Isoptericola variabilis]TWH25821.1 hypothetical protein L600_000900000710 [Isoptericola variabilis J7]
MPTTALSNRTPSPSVRAAVAPRAVLGGRARAAVAVLLALAVTLLGLALGVVTAGTAAAHDRLEASDPPADAQLTAPPVQIVLTYSGTVLDTGTQVVVTTPKGQVDTEVTVDGPEVRATLPADLPGGAYEVAWRVASSDGHPIEGTYGFTVAEQPEPAASPTEEAEPTQEPADTAATSEPAAEPTEAAAEDAADEGAGMPWLFALALLAIVAVAAAAIWRTRSRLHRGDGPAGQD